MSTEAVVYLDAKNLNLQQMQTRVQTWAAELNQERELVLLEGPMGAGKTQFLRWCFECLGVAEVASPTYAIHHEYSSARGKVDHLDLYRLNDEEDLESTGFWDLLGESSGLVFVEWADRLEFSQYPRNWRRWRVSIEIVSESLRNLTIIRY